MKETTASIAAWADATFGEVSSNMSIWQRADKEFQELRKKLEENDQHPDAPEEVADVIIVLQRILANYDLDEDTVVSRKMTKNRTRKWRLTGDGHGQHVEDEK